MSFEWIITLTFPSCLEQLLVTQESELSRASAVGAIYLEANFELALT